MVFYTEIRQRVVRRGGSGIGPQKPRLKNDGRSRIDHELYNSGEANGCRLRVDGYVQLSATKPSLIWDFGT